MATLLESKSLKLLGRSIIDSALRKISIKSQKPLAKECLIATKFLIRSRKSKKPNKAILKRKIDLATIMRPILELR